MELNFKKIKKATVYITPNFSEPETVRYKLKITKIFFWILTYTLAISLLTIIIVGITPIKNWLYYFEHKELKEQAEKTVELEKKVLYLSKELESLSSVNKKLKMAYILGTTDSLDSTSAIYDSLKYEPIKNLPYGGNILFIFQKVIAKILQEEVKNKNTDFFLNPSKGFIIKDFDPITGHLGIDFAAKSGSPVFSAKGGLIIFSDFTIDDGNKIIIQHDNGFITVYKHCSALIKKEREFVVQGELIALSGNSGKNTSGPHLHFEIWKNGKPINPKEILIQ
jgi:murein DD-endopeptidase MepM/ murein hydrolase activator NlpD